jgi:hypothetical protein
MGNVLFESKAGLVGRQQGGTATGQEMNLAQRTASSKLILSSPKMIFIQRTMDRLEQHEESWRNKRR